MMKNATDEFVIEHILKVSPAKVGKEIGVDFNVMYDKLASLQTVQDICLFFEEQGVKGIRGSAARCPISSYFWSEGHDVTTLFSSIYLSKGEDEYFSAPSTDAMTGFVVKFDKGYLPNLEEKLK